MLRVGFAGTPAFAATALAAILDAGYPVSLVLTQPDRPQGRGLRVAPPPVKALAEARGLAVLQPATLKSDEARAPVTRTALDARTDGTVVSDQRPGRRHSVHRA